MTELLDDEIRFLIAEIVDAAPDTIEAPPSMADKTADTDTADPPDEFDGDRGNGRFVVLAALIAVMFGVAGLIAFGSNGDQPVSTDTPTTTTVPEAEVDQGESDRDVARPEFLSQARRDPVEPLWTVDELEVFQRDPTPDDDGFPETVLAGRVATGPFPERFGELDPSRARRAVLTEKRALWVVPGTDNNSFCAFVVDENGSGSSCTSNQEGFRLPVYGSSGSSGTGATRTGYRANMVLNESIVKVGGLSVVNNWNFVELVGDEIADSSDASDTLGVELEFDDGTVMTLREYGELFDETCLSLTAAFFGGGEIAERVELDDFVQTARRLRQSVFDDVASAVEQLAGNQDGPLPLSLNWREAVGDIGRICFQTLPADRKVAVVSDEEPAELSIDDSNYATITAPVVAPSTGGIDGPPIVVYRDGPCRYAQLDPEVWEGDQIDLGCRTENKPCRSGSLRAQKNTATTSYSS